MSKGFTPTSERPSRDRDIHKVLQAIRGLKPTQVSRMADKRGQRISPSTVANWRKRPQDGGVKYPQHYTLAAAARAVGMRFVLADESTADEILRKQRSNGNGNR
jgi:hypothetical protein